MKVKPIHPSEGYTSTTVHFLQGNSDFETTIAVRILLTRLLLTYFQVSIILSFKGWLLLDQTLLLQEPTANLLLLSSWYHVCYRHWYRPPRLAVSLQASNSLLLNAHVPWQHYHICGFSSEVLLQQIPSTTTSTDKRTVTTFTTNLGPGFALIHPGGRHVCRLHFCEQRNREITLSAQYTFFIFFSSRFIHETLTSALPTPFPPLDSLSTSLGECCIPCGE